MSTATRNRHDTLNMSEVIGADGKLYKVGAMRPDYYTPEELTRFGLDTYRILAIEPYTGKYKGSFTATICQINLRTGYKNWMAI